MKTSTKYEIRRSVMRVMLPNPRWESWRSMPECSGNACHLYVAGNCACTKGGVIDGAPCKPCIASALERVK
jgi:hypothetical protein